MKYRAYIIERNYTRSFESPWFSTEYRAEKALELEYRRRGTSPEDPNVFGSGIEDDGTGEEA